MEFEALLKKYDVPVPRYTSYPPVPFWNTDLFDITRWKESVQKIFAKTNKSKGISLYVHLPFCESLCTYCACNTRITRNHNVEEKYIVTVLQEWKFYKDLFESPVIRELHLGGGTPTFFAPENLQKLINGLLSQAQVHPEAEFSFEGHPNNTSASHLQELYKLNFRRVSFGVQDLDSKVQRAINRIQPLENLERVTCESRNAGYASIGFDLIYGLPYQTKRSIEDTVKKIVALRPDRIAFYSYAHVPWMRPGQRGYEEADLPGGAVKRLIYETGRNLFLEAGYVEIGMDHFALPQDALATARKAGTLKRTFMGYTTSPTDLLIGLGASSISDSSYAYAQNLKKVEDYQQKILSGEWAVMKGHLQTNRDLIIKHCILEIACKGELSAELLHQVMTQSIFDELLKMQDERLLEWSQHGLKVTATGWVFIRNICSVFDETLKGHNKQAFSKAI